MATSDRQVSIGFAEGKVPEGMHLCHVYSDDKERARTMARFVERGLAEGARVLCLEDVATPEPMRRLLSEMGVDLAGREQALLTGNAEEAYCPSGRLVPEALLESFAVFCQKAVTDGYAGVRITGDMSWVVRRNVDEGTLIDYEMRATDYAKANRVVAVCEYDARKFDGRTIMDILSLHPAIIVRGQLVKNPLYVEPQEFLARRRAGASDSTRV